MLFNKDKDDASLKQDKVSDKKRNHNNNGKQSQKREMHLSKSRHKNFILFYSYTYICPLDWTVINRLSNNEEYDT